MEESLKMLKDMFGLEDTDIRTYSPLTLAYIGDAIYELVIRTILVEKGNTQVNKLHNRASRLVKASAQSAMIEKLKLISQRRRQRYLSGAEMQNLIPWPRMPACQITEGQPVLRR